MSLKIAAEDEGYKSICDELVLISECFVLCSKGPDSYYGTKGLRKVTCDSPTNGKVTFQFAYAAGNNNGTSVEDGQLPEIIFYT